MSSGGYMNPPELIAVQLASRLAQLAELSGHSQASRVRGARASLRSGQSAARAHPSAWPRRRALERHDTSDHRSHSHWLRVHFVVSCCDCVGIGERSESLKYSVEINVCHRCPKSPKSPFVRSSASRANCAQCADSVRRVRLASSAASYP